MILRALAPSADREEVLARLTSEGIAHLSRCAASIRRPGASLRPHQWQPDRHQRRASRPIRLPMWLTEVGAAFVEALTRILTLRA